jgi:iron complex transport system permease protein
MLRALRIWLLLAALAAAAFALALAIGSHTIAPLELLRVLLRPDDGVNAQIVHELRLPRALAAFGTGGLLALAGALMQVLLRNPLADPYVMGASGGAAVGALGAMLLGLGAAFTQGAAFGGALASTVLVFALARREFAGAALADPGLGAPRLLLAGVMLAALWTALVTLLLTLSPEARIRGMLFWLAGDLSAGSGGGAALLVLAMLVAIVWPLGRSLNVMLRGPVIALSLGVRVVVLRRALFVLASLATAVAMTSSGAVGFVGLVVPHALRLAGFSDHGRLLPLTALGGGALVAGADTIARTAAAPLEFPVGAVTALVGVPVLLALLARTR